MTFSFNLFRVIYPVDTVTSLNGSRNPKVEFNFINSSTTSYHLRSFNLNYCGFLVQTSKRVIYQWSKRIFSF